MGKMKNYTYVNESIKFIVFVAEVEKPIVIKIVEKYISYNGIRTIGDFILFETTQLIFDEIFTEIRSLGFEYDEERFNNFNYFMFKKVV